MNTIVTFMKRNYKILLVVLGLSVTLFAFKMNGAKTTDPEKILLELLTLLSRKDITVPRRLMMPFLKVFIKIIFKL
jgi:carboxyl-terminal processing protease